MIRRNSNAFSASNGIGKMWAETVSRSSIELGSDIASDFVHSLNGRKQKATESGEDVFESSDISNYRSKYLKCRLSSMLSLLLTSEVCSHFMGNSGNHRNSNSSDFSQDAKRMVHAGVARELLKEAVERLTPHVVPGLLSRSDTLADSRDVAFKELEDAVSMLHAELAALNAQE
mmetsp:Transcript_3111/g.4266  ORF Transcript_3111/g.4266 Transcript_3111/m.4266 type:complete len:174 (-) Transcript_3111:131-652(-)